MIQKRIPTRPWTTEESDRAVVMYYQGATMVRIGFHVGHTPGSVWSHLRSIEFGNMQERRRRHHNALMPTPGPVPPANVVRERDYRRSLSPATISAAIFGDPLPGYSALERRV